MSRALSKKFLNSAAAVAAVAYAAFALPAFAAPPTLSATLTGGDSVQLNITGDAGGSVILNYLDNAATVKMTSLGATNSSGSFTMTISTAAYSIAPGSLFNVSVNGQRSDSLAWPYGALTSGSGTISLSQSSITVGAGQTAVVTVNNTTGNSLYLASNTSPSVASVSLNNNQFTIYGLAAGGTTLQICSAANASNCTTAVVTVTSAGFSSGAVAFSQSNPTLMPGQVVAVTVSGGSGSYTLSNSNNNVVQANIVGSTLTLYGNSPGSATLTVCAANGGCGTLGVTVASGSSATLTLNPTSLTLNAGQSSNVTLTGLGGYAVAQNSNSTVASAVISGTTLVVTAASPGSTTITVCQSGGNCTLLSVVVNAASFSQSPTSVSVLSARYLLTVGQELKLALSGGTGVYTLSGNPGSPFATELSGNVLKLRAVAVGEASVNVCGGASCLAVGAQVSPAPVIPVSAPVPPNVVAVSKYVFTKAIAPGAKGTDVVELQKRLKDEGFMTDEATGFFGAATLAAVKKFQIANGLEPLGTVGPGTRAALNK